MGEGDDGSVSQMRPAVGALARRTEVKMIWQCSGRVCDANVDAVRSDKEDGGDQG